MQRTAFGLLPIALMLGLSLSGCSDKSPEPAPGSDTATSASTTPKALQTAVSTQADTTCADVELLRDDSKAFLEQPTPGTLENARNAWRTAHQSYRELAFLYQLTGLKMPQQKNDRDAIDAYPMLPGYLDQVPGYPRSGLVYSDVPLTPDFLRKEHQSTDFYYLTLGFHPLEAMLWPAGAPSPEDVVRRFRIRQTAEEDRINAPQRRHDLLRLIATGLKRDSQPLCATPNEAYLIGGLTDLHASPKRAAARIEKTLMSAIGETLNQWSQHPDGEDRNGMPLAQSPRALTDFTELAGTVRMLASEWIPALMEASGTDKPLTQALETLAAQLEAIGPGNTPLTTESLKKARATLQQISEILTGMALKETS